VSKKKVAASGHGHGHGHGGGEPEADGDHHDHHGLDEDAEVTFENLTAEQCENIKF
jgi:hypothetical protein